MANNVNSKTVLSQLQTLRANPALTQQYLLNLLENVTDGEVVMVDATNPFSYLLECSVLNSASAIIESDTNTRYQYQSLAMNYQDLYRHMADADYIGRFSEPARTTMNVLMGLDEIKQKAVLENSTGVRKLTIPRYARFSVAELVFTSLYPIDIRVMPHGGINITYDVSEKSPIENISSNIVDYRLINIENTQWLELTIPVKQVDIYRLTASMSTLSTFSRKYSLAGKLFYYCRAFNRVGNEWVEMHTTHTDKVFDPLKPTALLRVLNDNLEVNIPSVYFNSNLITDSVRFDIYVTDGPIDLSLDSYAASLFEVKWSTLTNEIVSPFTAPLDTFNAIAIYSADSVTGGSKGMSFNELRERVVTRSTVTEGLPITGKQLSNKLRDMGYNLVTNIDNITDRQFLATRSLPEPSQGNAVTAISSAIQTLNSTIGNIVLNTNSTRNNDRRITILPNTVYQFNDGILSIYSDVQVQALLANKSLASVASQVNQMSLLYSPFYYVLDKSANDFRCRIYDLNGCEFKSRFFFQTNTTVGHVFTVKDYSFGRMTNYAGYMLEVNLEVGSELLQLPAKHLDVQMSYLDVSGKYRYFIKGKLFNHVNSEGLIELDSNGEVIYQFEIHTHYDIDDEDHLVLTPESTLVNLIHEFDIVTCIGNGIQVNSYEKGDIDRIIEDGDEWYGVNQEKVLLKFGQNLKHLYQRSRTVVNENDYEKHQTDKPLTYKEDVYLTDSTGSPVISVDAKTQKVSMTLIHDKGDVVVTPAGDALYEYRKGDTVLDAFGSPVLVNNGMGLKVSVDIYLLDAKYYFANTENVLTYRNNTISQVVDWVTSDMVTISEQLLERSEIFYHPTSTAADIYVNADNNKYVSTKAEQSLTVTYYLMESNYNNSQLRKAISDVTAKTINIALNKSTVSIDSIINQLKLAVGSDVIGINLAGFMENRYSVATIEDTAMRLSVGKRLVALANGLLDVIDDIEVVFVLHND